MVAAAEMERMMNLQDVILKAMAKRISWMAAAEIGGVSDRTMRRIKQRYEEVGYDGLFDQRRGKRSIHRIALETGERVLALYQEKYFDSSVRHFHEKLGKEHQIQVSYSWVKQALQGAGLVKRRSKRGWHRRRRPRRPLPGMLLHIDGSKHRWFQDDRYDDLIVILDDATSEIYSAHLGEEESTMTVLAGLREVSKARVCSARCIATGAATFFTRRRRAARWTRAGRRKWGERCKNWGFKPLRPTRRRHGGGRNATSGRGRIDCRRSCAGRASGSWRKPICFCGSATSPNSTATSQCPRRRKGPRFAPIAGRISTLSSRCRPSASSARTTRWRSGSGGGKSKRADGATAGPNRR